MAQHASGRKPNRAERRARRAEQGGIEPSDGLRADVLRFIGENPSRATKRDIARAFDLKGDDRIALKNLLRELQDDGALERTGKRLHEPGALPGVTVLDIVDRDRDGLLVGTPVEERLGERRVPVLPGRSQKGPPPGVGDRVLVRIQDEGDGPAARVMKVITKRPRAALGVFRALPEGGGRVEPTDRRGDVMAVRPEDANGAKDGDLVEVESRGSGRLSAPRARVVEVIGSVASERAVSMIAIHEHEIPQVFPEKALAEAEAAEPVTAKGMENREDWRDRPLVTIDPATAKDHDDAVMGEPDTDPDNEGGVIATVAIADVAAYVRPGSALDREARKRGNSVYFPDRVVPMLPERISNDLCSLREGEDRPAVAVRMVFDREGTKRSHSFHRVLIRVPLKLAYEEAQEAFEGRPSERAAEHREVLANLLATYRTMLVGRERREPLEINAPERRVILNEDGTVRGVEVPPRLEAHRLIEEFMVQANVCAAETLERKKTPLVFRVHEPPALAKMEALREFLASLELTIQKGRSVRPHHFNGVLRRVEDEGYRELVNQVVLRSQSQAEYDPVNAGHFGLNLARYAHFTSPIRRYADLVVHRGLIAAHKWGDEGLTETEAQQLGDTAEHISTTERRAAQAERDTLSRLIAAFLSDQIDAEFRGRIQGVSKAGLFVTLDETGADGFVPISKLGEEYYRYDEGIHALVGEDTGTGYQLGDPVEVRLVEAAPVAGALRFEMLTDGKPMPRQNRSAHKLRTGAKRSRGGRADNARAAERTRSFPRRSKRGRG